MPRQLPLRADQPPDDATIIVRAGVLDAAHTLEAAQRTFDTYAIYGVSVEAVVDATVLEACLASERLAAYRRIRLSTFGRLRSGGFALLASFDHPHFTVVLPDVSELTVARLRSCFDEPIPNPGRKDRAYHGWGTAREEHGRDR